MPEGIKYQRNGRVAWLDNVKFFAILCVIFYHCNTLVVKEMYYVGWIIETFNMALFFFLSGLTSYHSIEKIESIKDLLAFIKKKFNRIMLPCMFVSLLVFQKPCSFWFLLTLFYYLISFAVFQYICIPLKVSKLWAFFPFCLLILIDIPKVGNDQEFIIVFGLGLFLSRVKIIDKLPKIPKWKTQLTTICGFAVWLLLIPFYQSFYIKQFNILWQDHTFYLFVIRQMIEISFAIACCIFFMHHFDKLTRFSKWGGKL